MICLPFLALHSILIDMKAAGYYTRRSSPFLILVLNLNFVELGNLVSYILMIPYHDHSKSMIGVVDQFCWADSFVT
jgi:hypothetical protein